MFSRTILERINGSEEERIPYLHKQARWLAEEEQSPHSVLWLEPEPERVLSVRALKGLGDAARESWMKLWR